MITATNLISEIKSRFPAFQVDIEFADLLTLIGGDLQSYLIKNEKNPVVTDAAVKFINEVVDSFDSDDSCGAFSDEIVLGMYTNSINTYNIYINKLSEKARKYFDYGIFLWRRQYD